MTKGGTVRPPCFAERRPLPRSALAHAPRLRRWLAFFCKACAYRIESTSAQGASVAQPGDEEEPAASFRPDFELGTPKQNATANADPGDGHAAFHPGKLIRMRGRSLSPPLSPPPPSTCSNCVATPRAPSRTLTGRAAGAAGVSPACAPRFLVRRVPRSATRRAACGIGSRGTLTSSIRVASTRRAARGARRLARKRTRARASAPRTARRITWTRCTRAASPPRVGAPPRSGTPKIHGALRCTAMPTARAVRPPAPAPPARSRAGVLAEHFFATLVNILCGACQRTCTFSPAGFANVGISVCTVANCSKRALYREPRLAGGVAGDPAEGAGGAARRFCQAHRPAASASVGGTRCGAGGCSVQASFGWVGKRRERCGAHREPGMGNLRHRKCACGKIAS